MRAGIENVRSGELVQDDGGEGHLSLELDLSLNGMNEKMSSSSSREERVHSKKIGHPPSKIHTVTRSEMHVDRQTQMKTVSRIVTLTSTRTLTHISAKWSDSPSASATVGVPLKDTISSSYGKMVQQTGKPPVSNSHWPGTSHTEALSSQSKDHSGGTSGASHATILSVNSTTQTTMWNSIRTVASQVCNCVDDVVSGTSAPTGADRCGNGKKQNATTWSMNKAGRLMGATIAATTKASHIWKNSHPRSTSMANPTETVASASSNQSPAADVSRNPQLLLVKNHADSIRGRKQGFGLGISLFVSIAVCTMLDV